MTLSEHAAGYSRMVCTMTIITRRVLAVMCTLLFIAVFLPARAEDECPLPWSNKRQCNDQFAADWPICKAILNKRKKALCFESMNERNAYCIKTGKTGHPPLQR
jgi:hypothetical protein